MAKLRPTKVAPLNDFAPQVMGKKGVREKRQDLEEAVESLLGCECSHPGVLALRELIRGSDHPPLHYEFRKSVEVAAPVCAEGIDVEGESAASLDAVRGITALLLTADGFRIELRSAEDGFRQVVRVTPERIQVFGLTFSQILARIDSIVATGRLTKYERPAVYAPR